jgi:integrase
LHASIQSFMVGAVVGRENAMPRRIQRRVTAREVAALRPGMHCIADNLYLSVTSPASRAWIFRYQRGGKRREMGLGPYPLVSLSRARALADDHRRALVVDGLDPLEQRAAAKVAAAKAGHTFEWCALEHAKAMSANWTSKRHAAEWVRSLRGHVFPLLGALPIADVDLPRILAVLGPLWAVKPETASRVRGRIEVILDWARVRGFREGENPARWRGHLATLLPRKSRVRPVQHFTALPYAELPELIARLREQESGPAAAALEFCILTAARTSEVLGAQWGEFALAEALWIVPPERVKARVEHRAPLSPAALAIVERMAETRHSRFVFPGAHEDRQMNSGAMIAVLRRMGVAVSVHGFRAAFSTWASERTAYPVEVRESCLGHVIGSAVSRAYARSDLLDRRRQLLAAWASYLGVL